MTTRITEDNLDQSVLSIISAAVSIADVISTNVNYVPLETNTVSTSGGFVKILGTGFIENTQVHIQSGNTYTLASVITYVSTSEIRSELPAKSAGTYNVYVTLPSGAFALKINGVTYA